MKTCHFMYVPFTGLGLRGGYRGDTWLKNRIEIFKRFTLQSLLMQTNQDFILWISWRPEDAKNPLVEAFADFLAQTPIEAIFTYGGIMFWDDKYTEAQAHWRLWHALSDTLPALKEVVDDADTVLMTIQPSDDIYLPIATQWIRDSFQKTKNKTVGFTRGYIMDYSTKEIAEYNPTTHPPFYTIRFPSYVFLNPKAHYEYIGPYHSHEYVPEFTPMEPRMFVVGTHGENISTTYQHPYKGNILPTEEADEILIATGTYHSDPISIRRGARLVLRTIFNRIPFNDLIRTLYHKLPANVQRI